MKQGLCRCLQVTDYLAKQMCSQRGTEQNRRQQASYWAHKQRKRGKQRKEKKKKDFHGNQPEFLVPFITVVITSPVSVSLLKCEFREGRGRYVRCFSVVLPAPSFRNRFHKDLPPGSARVTQTSKASPRSPLTYLSE